MTELDRLKVLLTLLALSTIALAVSCAVSP